MIQDNSNKLPRDIDSFLDTLGVRKEAKFTRVKEDSTIEDEAEGVDGPTVEHWAGVHFSLCCWDVYIGSRSQLSSSSISSVATLSLSILEAIPSSNLLIAGFGDDVAAAAVCLSL